MLPSFSLKSSHDGAARPGLTREDLFNFFADELRYNVFLIKDFLAAKPP